MALYMGKWGYNPHNSMLQFFEGHNLHFHHTPTLLAQLRTALRRFGGQRKTCVPLKKGIIVSQKERHLSSCLIIFLRANVMLVFVWELLFFSAGISAIHHDIGIRKIVIGCTVMWFKGQLVERVGLYPQMPRKKCIQM